MACDPLVGAETGSLNRRAIGLGLALMLDRPFPQSRAIAQIEKARAALTARNIAGTNPLSEIADQKTGFGGSCTIRGCNIP